LLTVDAPDRDIARHLDRHDVAIAREDLAEISPRLWRARANRVPPATGQGLKAATFCVGSATGRLHGRDEPLQVGTPATKRCEATAQFWIGRLGWAARCPPRPAIVRGARIHVRCSLRLPLMDGVRRVQLTDSAEFTLRKDLLIRNLRSSSVMPLIASSIFTPRRCNSRSSWYVFTFLESCA
jgi:hypothetical protein